MDLTSWKMAELLMGEIPISVLLLVLMMTVVLVFLLTQRKNPALNKIPGPTRLPIIGSTMEFVWNRFQIIPTFRKLADKYDGIYRFDVGCLKSGTLIMLTKPEYLQIFYTNKVNTRKSRAYQPIVEAIGDTIFTASDKKWRELREMSMKSFFSANAEVQMEPMVNQVPALIEILHEKANGQTFQAYEIIKSANIKSMSLNTLGENLPKSLEYVLGDIAEYLMKLAFLRSFYVQYTVKFIFCLLPAGKKFFRYAEELNEIVTRLIRRKRKEFQEMESQCDPVPDSYINKMLGYKNVTDQMLADEFKLLFVAGSDTSTATACFLLTCLGIYPDIQQKIFEEDADVQKMLGGREPTFDDMKHYQYLERAIKETLRFFPTGPVAGRSLTEDTYFGEYLIPAGTDVIILPIHTNSDPKLFTNPLEFDPDRFLPEKSKNLPPYVFNPFSLGGPRSCPGSRYAYTVIKTYVSTIVRNFVIKSPYKSVQEVLQNCDAEITFKDKNKCSISLTPR